jgi:hypothetical protein
MLHFTLLYFTALHYTALYITELYYTCLVLQHYYHFMNPNLTKLRLLVSVTILYSAIELIAEPSAPPSSLIFLFRPPALLWCPITCLLYKAYFIYQYETDFSICAVCSLCDNYFCALVLYCRILRLNNLLCRCVYVNV